MTANRVVNMLDKGDAYLDLSRLDSMEDAALIADYLDEYGFLPWDGTPMLSYIKTRFITLRDYHCLITDKRNTQRLTANMTGLSYATRVTAASFIAMIKNDVSRRISAEDFDSILI